MKEEIQALAFADRDIHVELLEQLKMKQISKEDFLQKHECWNVEFKKRMAEILNKKEKS